MLNEEATSCPTAENAPTDNIAAAAVPPTITPVNEPIKRDYTIDNYRGFVIFAVFIWCCMFLAMPGGFSWVKHTDSHGVDIGFGLMDYGIMMFTLAAGMIMNVVYEKKVAKGLQTPNKIRAEYARRGLAVMGVGGFNLAFLMIGNNAIDSPYGWEVFMDIGFASMMVAPFLGRKKWIRVLAGALFMIFFAIISEYVPVVHQTLYSGKLSYGGPFASFGLAGAILWITVLGDYFQTDKKKFLLGVLLIWLLAIPSIVISYSDCTGPVCNIAIEDMIAAQRTLAISFNNFTLGFILFGTAFALLTFMPIWGISALIKREIPFIATMGKNTIVFFFTYAIFTLPAAAIWNALGSKPALAIFLNALMVVAVTFPMAYLFKKKNIIIKA